MESSAGKFMEKMQHVSVFQVRRRFGDSITARFPSSDSVQNGHDLLSDHSVLSLEKGQADNDRVFSTLRHYEEDTFRRDKIVMTMPAKSINNHAEVYHTTQTPSDAIVCICTTPLLQHHHIIP